MIKVNFNDLLQFDLYSSIWLINFNLINFCQFDWFNVIDLDQFDWLTITWLIYFNLIHLGQFHYRKLFRLYQFMQFNIAGLELTNLYPQGERAKLWAIGTVNKIVRWTQQDIWVSVIVTAQQQTHTPHKLETTWSSLKRLRDGPLKVFSPRLPNFTVLWWPK